MKNLKKISLLIIFTIIFTIIFSVNLKAEAYSAICWDKWMTSGKDIAYYITSDCEYTSSIPQAVKLLVNPSGMWNPMKLSATTVQKHSKMDFFQIYNAGEFYNTAAYTIIYRKTDSGYTGLKVNNGYTEPDIYEWVYGDITLNDYLMSSYTTTDRKLTILHEMLHVYGLRDLKEDSDKWSIMYGARRGCTATGLTSDANDVLIAKYDY